MKLPTNVKFEGSGMINRSFFKEKAYKFLWQFEKVYFTLPVIIFLCTYIYLGVEVAIRSLLFVVPLILSSLFIAKYKKNTVYINDFNAPSLLPLKTKKLTILILFNFFLGIVSLDVLIMSESRTLIYLFIMALMGTILVLEIFSEGKMNYLIFFSQLLFIQISLTYGLTLKYPFYYGFGDLVSHLKWIEIIVQNNHIGTQFGYSLYSNFPLYHIFFAVGSILTGLAPKDSTFVLSGLLMPIATIFVFLISHNITKNIRLSLLSSIFFVYSRDIIFYSAYMITRSFAFILVIFILYLLQSSNQSNKKVLLILFTFALILTHQTTVLHFFIIIFVLLISSWLFKGNYTKLRNYFQLYFVAYIAYWLFKAQEFFGIVIASLKSESKIIEETSFTKISLNPSFSLPSEFIFLFNRIDLMMLIFMLSIFVYIYMRKPLVFKKISYVLIPSFFFAAFYFPSPLLLFVESTHLFLIYRLPLLVSSLIALISAIGFIVLLKSVDTNKSRIILCCVIFWVFSSFALINDQNAMDSSKIKDLYGSQKCYYSAKELESFSFANKYNIGPIYTDIDSDIFLRHYLFMRSKSLPLDFFEGFWSVGQTNNYVLLNIKELTSNFVYLSGGSIGFGTDKQKYKWIPSENGMRDIDEINPNLKRKCLIYNNDGIRIYH